MEDERSPQPPEPARRSLSSGDLATAWSLDEFFQALGPVMRLPPKANESVAPPPAAENRPRTTARARVLVAVAALLILGGVASGPLLAALFPSPPLPAELFGTWRTSAERYADRTFELSRDSLRLGIGKGTQSYPIVRLQRQTAPGVTRYTLGYTDAGSTLEFAFSVDGESVIQIRNLPEVAWRKATP